MAAEILGVIQNALPSDENRTVPSKTFYDKDLGKIKDPESHKIFHKIDRHLKKKGLNGLDMSKCQGDYKWTHSDGSKSSIYRIKKGKIRILLSYIVDDPESLLEKPVFYLHAIFVKNKQGSQSQYPPLLKRISKQKRVDNYKFEDMNSSDIQPEKCFNEVWKTKEMYPYTPLNQEDYNLLKILSEKSEMAVSPTADQIKAIYESEKPLFINGQAGTGKTTGISFLLCLAIPSVLTLEDTPRTLVTAMTETVVKKLENNTHRVFDAHHHKLEPIFKLDQNSIVNFMKKSEANKNKWYNEFQIDENENIVSEEGPKLAFVDFKTILEDIIYMSQDDIISKTSEISALIDNPGNCDDSFDINNPNSIKNRKITCKYCIDNPSFHFRWANLEFDDPEKISTLNLYARLNDLKQIIISKEVSSNVTYSQFLLEFFGPRRNDFDILPEFAWYGIRTLIKGMCAENNYYYLSEQEFDELIDTSSKNDFSGKIRDLFNCYRKYEQWLWENDRRDEIDVATDAAFLMNTFQNAIHNKFDRVYLDEAQDLTTVEYTILMLLLNEECKNEIVLAGDPLQTINPTGFDWDRIKDLMYANLGKRPDNPHILNHNWRTPSNIVEISNGILELRRKIIHGESVEHQQAHEPGEKPVLIYLNNKSGSPTIDLDTLADFVTTKTTYKVAVRKSDEKGLKDLIENDDLLKHNIDVNENNFYTVTEIKGDEGDTIVLYRTGEMKSTDLNHLLSDKENLQNIATETQIQLKFIINQLYILITRSSRNLYIIEADQHKGRIWTELFSDLIEIEEDPDDLLKNIIETADSNFELGSYVQEQLRKWGEDNNPKWLKRAEQNCTKIKDKRKLTASERNEHSRVIAILAENNKEFEKAGDHWKKIQEGRKSFACYIKAKCWKKARESKVVDAQIYSNVLNYLEDRDSLSINDLIALLELAIQKFNSTETIPSWFINMELELSQFLFDCAIYLRKKEYNEYIIPLERLSKLKLINELKTNAVKETLDYLIDKKEFERLRVFVKEIESSDIIFDIGKFKIFYLEDDLKSKEEYSLEKTKILHKLLNLSKLNKRKFNKYWRMLALNILESMEIKSSENLNLASNLSRAMRDHRLDTGSQQDEFVGNALVTKNTSNNGIRDLFILMKNSKEILREREKIPSLVDTFSLVTKLNGKLEQKKHKDFHSLFGQKTLNYLRSKDVQEEFRNFLIQNLRRSSPQELTNESSIIDCYKSFDWEPSEWCKYFGLIYVDVHENNMNRQIIDVWREWFRSQISDETSYQNSETLNIISSIIGSEKQWILESDAEMSENQHLIKRLEMEKIRQSPLSEEEQLISARTWFTKNNMPREANEILSRLPNNLTKEIESSLSLDLDSFSNLIETVISSQNSNDELQAMCQKITEYGKRMRLHELLSTHNIEKLLMHITQDSDVGEFLTYYVGKRYEMFRHYAHNNNSGRIERALYKLVANVYGYLEQQPNIGQYYSFIRERWINYEEDEDYGKIFAESSLCCIIIEITEKKMTNPELLDLSSEINSVEIRLAKKSEMVKSILLTFNNSLEVESDSNFIDQIVEHI